MRYEDLYLAFYRIENNCFKIEFGNLFILNKFDFHFWRRNIQQMALFDVGQSLVPARVWFLPAPVGDESCQIWRFLGQVALFTSLQASDRFSAICWTFRSGRQNKNSNRMRNQGFDQTK